MKEFNLEDVGEILQRLNDSGINAHVSWYELDGFEYVIGNSVMGHKRSKPRNSGDPSSVISMMAYEAALLFPNSPFAKWYEQTTVVKR